nr:MAG: E1 protein [Neophocaena asiaeorientalis asiaeorientalis papillomavirus 3]
MDNTQGTDPMEGGSGLEDWVLLEAEDADGQGGEDEDEDDLSEDFVDFIDNCNIDSSLEEHMSLFSQQQREDDARAVQSVKRKFSDSPKSKADTLSPRLAAISLLERTGRARRRLYRERTEDSGHGNSLEDPGDGSVVVATQVQVQNYEREGETPVVVHTSSNLSVENAGSSQDSAGSVMQLLRCAKPRVVLLGCFKDMFACSFTDLTRSFKSDSTACEDWVCFMVGVPCSLADAVQELVKSHTVYSHITTSTCRLGVAVLLLARWKTAKNRGTVKKLLGGLLALEGPQMLLEPPRVRNVGAAMFWYKKAMCNGTIVTGETPDWIVKEVCLQNQIGEACAFSLSEMVQWGYDNGIQNESTAAYEYALLADVDKNAEAFLRSNNQAKYVKDCMSMLRLYRLAEMNRMTMSQWILHRSRTITGEGNWKQIVKFLKFQGVELIGFLRYFSLFLKGVPKKNCLVLYGAPNTGKSLFAMSLMEFLDGKTISHVNSSSHFWLQPLTECKAAMLDDATGSTWDYFDTYLRTVLDGNTVCVDKKHRAPVQLRCPPLIVTTNIDVRINDKYKYLHSRLKVVEFPNEMPLSDDGEPVFQLTAENWKSFFLRCRSSLGLEDADQEGNDGNSDEVLQPLRCTARRPDGPP